MPRPRDTGAEARILDAAVRRHAQGDDAWTLGALAEDAGVSRASLYRRFRSREALLERLACERDLDLREAAPADTRTRILDALSHLLRRGSLAATTLDEVARQAGVSSVTVYRHFGDRRGLLQAFASERSPRRLAARLRIAAGEDLEGELLALARGALGFVREYRELVLLALSADPETEEFFAHLRSLPGTTREALTGFLQRHVDAGRIVGEPARMVPLFVGGLLSLALATPDAAPEELDANARFAVDAFLHGVRSPTPPATGSGEQASATSARKAATTTTPATRTKKRTRTRTRRKVKRP